MDRGRQPPDAQRRGRRRRLSDPGNFMLRAYYARKLGSEMAISAPDKSGRFWIQGVKYF